MEKEVMPKWLASLEAEDIVFIKKFVVSSGSLKDMAKEYNVTYPTLRVRLDRLIEKIRLSDDEIDDHYILTIKHLAIDGKIDVNTAKILISEYRRRKK